jgi:hypothetical protein
MSIETETPRGGYPEASIQLASTSIIRDTDTPAVRAALRALRDAEARRLPASKLLPIRHRLMEAVYAAIRGVPAPAYLELDDEAKPKRPKQETIAKNIVPLTLDKPRCGALLGTGQQCGRAVRRDDWTCPKHAGWLGTATPYERQQLAWLEIGSLIRWVATPEPAPADLLASVRLRLERLVGQELVRHRGDLAGTALESDILAAQAELDGREAPPAAYGFTPGCPCAVCREVQDAQLVPQPDVDLRSGYLAPAAWLGYAGRRRNANPYTERVRTLQLPKRMNPADRERWADLAAAPATYEATLSVKARLRKWLRQPIELPEPAHWLKVAV